MTRKPSKTLKDEKAARSDLRLVRCVRSASDRRGRDRARGVCARRRTDRRGRITAVFSDNAPPAGLTCELLALAKFTTAWSHEPRRASRGPDRLRPRAPAGAARGLLARGRELVLAAAAAARVRRRVRRPDVVLRQERLDGPWAVESFRHRSRYIVDGESLVKYTKRALSE